MPRWDEVDRVAEMAGLRLDIEAARDLEASLPDRSHDRQLISDLLIRLERRLSDLSAADDDGGPAPR